MNYIYALVMMLMIMPGCTWFKTPQKPEQIKADVTCDAQQSMDEKQKTATMFDHSLMKAAALNNVKEIKSQLEQGFSINKQDEKVDGITALMVAAHMNNLESVQTLLDAGADVNIASKHGRTPLMFAAEGGCNAIVQLLLNRGANPAVRAQDQNNLGPSALVFAIANNHPTIVKTLLEQKGQKNLINDMYRIEPLGDLTPLMIAALKGYPTLVDSLIQAGADVNKKNNDGNTAFLLAARGVDVTSYPWGLEFRAIPDTDSIAIMKQLQKQGAQATATDTKGNSALHLALKNRAYVTAFHSIDHNLYNIVAYILQTASDTMSKKKFTTLTNDQGQTAHDISQEALQRLEESLGKANADEAKLIQQKIDDLKATIKLLD